MLELLSSLDHPLIRVLDDDPVRPEIPHYLRVQWPNSLVYILVEGGEPQAVVCAVFTDKVPKGVDELFDLDCIKVVDKVIFYTIWSYNRGSGGKLIFAVKDWVERNRPEIKEFITLSPPNEMARNFHLRNGARVRQHNGHTVNYQYD